MKKLIGITALTLLLTISMSAQKKEKQKNKRADFTSEQIATLKVKKMTLALDLSDAQQRELIIIEKVLAEEKKEMRSERKENKEKSTELSSDDKFELQLERLDKMIAHKAAVKKILTNAQYEKWNDLMLEKMKNQPKNRGNQKGNKTGGKGAIRNG